MSRLPSLREAWILAAANPVGNGLRAFSFEGGGPRVMATVTDEGHHGLLLSWGGRQPLQPTLSVIKAASPVIGAESYSFQEDGGIERGLHIWNRRPDLADIFGGFGDALVARLATQEDVAAAFLECLEDFRALVSGEREEAQPPDLVGLLGELVVLSELVSLDAAAARLWAYPDRDRHDFRSGGKAMEVKTSVRARGGRPLVTITSIDQLEAPVGGSLHLQYLRLEHDPAGPLSIERLVDDLLPRLEDELRRTFRERVLADGVLRPGHQRRYAVQERRAFRVTDDFPRLSHTRLIAGQLDPGVGRVTYELDLSVAARHECPPEVASREFLAGGARP